jgi:hypothetical protein
MKLKVPAVEQIKWVLFKFCCLNKIILRLEEPGTYSLFLADYSLYPMYLQTTGVRKFGTNGNFNFYYYFYLKINRLKMALTLDERVEIVLLSGSQGWTQRQVADEFNARHPELQTCATVDPNMLSKIRTNMVKRLRKCVECRGEHIEHIMQIKNTIPIGSRLFGHPVQYNIERCGIVLHFIENIS